MVVPSITIGGIPLPAQLLASVTHITYKEGLVFTGDTVSLSISDPKGIFRRNFRLKAALPVTLSIAAGGKVRDAGTFYIHTVRMKGDKGGGSDIDIEATSIPIKPECSVRTERKSRGTEKTTLKDLAAKVATENGLTLQYQAADNPKLGRDDQHDESDLVHLGKHCQQNDFALKIRKDTLWILDHEALEKQSPVGAFVLPLPGNPGGFNGTGGVISWELNECVEDIYKAAEVSFKDHKTGKTVTALVSDPGNADLGITHRVKANPHDDEDTDTDASSTSTEED
jgi:phage protein D